MTTDAEYVSRKAARLRDLADDLPRGPWSHRRTDDGALLLEAGDEPLALIYAGLPLARYLEAVSPAELLAVAGYLYAGEAAEAPE